MKNSFCTSCDADGMVGTLPQYSAPDSDAFCECIYQKCERCDEPVNRASLRVDLPPRNKHNRPDSFCGITCLEIDFSARGGEESSEEAERLLNAANNLALSTHDSERAVKAASVLIAIAIAAEAARAEQEALFLADLEARAIQLGGVVEYHGRNCAKVSQR